MALAERPTERVTVLMPPSECRALEKAEAAGVSISDLVRRSVDGFAPRAADEMQQMAALAAELTRSNRDAAATLDDALASLQETLFELR